MREVAKAMCIALDNPDDDKKLEEARQIVKSLCNKYPLYGING